MKRNLSSYLIVVVVVEPRNQFRIWHKDSMEMRTLLRWRQRPKESKLSFSDLNFFSTTSILVDLGSALILWILFKVSSLLYLWWRNHNSRHLFCNFNRTIFYWILIKILLCIKFHYCLVLSKIQISDHSSFEELFLFKNLVF